MRFIFEIPRSSKDLLEDANRSNYFVKQIYDANEISKHLRTAHQALKSNDAFYIFDFFDIFFSVIENAEQLRIDTLMRSVDILYRTAENLGHMLDAYLCRKSLDRQNDFLNLTKMVMYLLVNNVRVVDIFMKNLTRPHNAAGRKNKQNNDDMLPLVASYNLKRYEVMLQICNIMHLPIEKLWNMSIIEEDFVNLLCDFAYRSVSHPSATEKRVNNAIFQIFGMAIKQYRHGIAFPVQIVDRMDREESAVVIIARGVHYLNDEFGITSVLTNLLKELIDKVNVSPATSTTSKHLSLFITEIGEISPELSVQCLEMSQDLLNLESYTIRNSLFGLAHNILVNHLNGEELNDDQKTLRDDCLEDLYNHMNDVSSYVRSKVLQIWNNLKCQNAVPLDWILPIVTRAIERLNDKTAIVRKNAISLLKSFLESNPFSSKLHVNTFEEKLKQEEEKLQIIQDKSREQYRNQKDMLDDYYGRCVPELEPIFTNILSNSEQINSLLISGKIEETESHERVEKVRQYLKDGHFTDVAKYIIQLDALCDNQNNLIDLQVNEQVLFFIALLKTYLFDDFESLLEKQAYTIEFLKDALKFSEAMVNAVPKLEELLMSITVTDTMEAIGFFKTGYLFNIKGTEVGLRLMLRLLYINTGQDKNDKSEAVLKSYHQILFGTDATGIAHHHKVVGNLCTFLQQITTGDYIAFDLMIKHWVRSGDIDNNIINILFERYTLKLADTSMNMARCCLELLILISNAKPSVAKSNAKLIIDIINSNRILQDPRIYSSSLQLLMTSVQIDKNDNNNGTYYKRFDDEEAIDGIIRTFKKFFFFPKLPDFEIIATQTIDFLYKMCCAPDLLCQEIINFLCKKLIEFSEKLNEQMMQVDGSDVESSQFREIKIPKILLPRIIFIFGYIATKEMAYLHNDVTNNIKYRYELNKNKNKNNDSAQRNTLINQSPLKRLSSQNYLDAEDENDSDHLYMGATAEDSLGEMINHICENELIGSVNGLLHHFVPILIEILSHPVKYKDDYVQRSAVLALMRFMTVSGVLCLDYMAFLMNILQKTNCASMKCNIIVGLADLTGRYANTVEPWIPNFFTLLLEKDVSVRLTIIRMLSYVILQAIIRVTGQVAEIAVCIIDENRDIQNAAKEFFLQLASSKESEYCKIVPDIVSRLSSNESPMAEEKFRIVMRYLYEPIHKDLQLASMVEKLCSRFRNTNTERQWRDTAFCLSLLNPTEKTMKKLIEHLPSYKDKIQCDEIYDCFKLIISNANKQMMKPGLKDLTKELDTKLQKCLRAGDVSTIEFENNLSPVKSKPRDKKTTKKKVRPRITSSDEDDDDFEENIPPRKRAPKRK